MRFFVIKMKYVILSAVVFVALGCVAFIVGNTVEDVGNMQKEVPIYCVETDEKKIAITFDCAWNADDVDSIIETLKKYDCKATFFVVGDWLERFPDEVKKLSDNGHEIANHSYGHGHFNSMSKEQMLSDMQKCDDKIKEVTGIAPTLFRAPYGEYNDLLIKTCRERGRIYIQWSVDSLDTKILQLGTNKNGLNTGIGGLRNVSPFLSYKPFNRYFIFIYKNLIDYHCGGIVLFLNGH